ncbi:MAG: hypothetical protein JO033_14495 [Acidobacteriaceae bacterium]|nr:hypothetical protein [Acidobacteriaceae bacterium]
MSTVEDGRVFGPSSYLVRFLFRLRSGVENCEPDTEPQAGFHPDLCEALQAMEDTKYNPQGCSSFRRESQPCTISAFRSRI